MNIASIAIGAGVGYWYAENQKKGLQEAAELKIKQLQERIDALATENEKLKASAAKAPEFQTKTTDNKQLMPNLPTTATTEAFNLQNNPSLTPKSLAITK